MAELLKGAPVAEAINNRTIADVDMLKQKGIEPTLCILRVGERPDDLSYERTAEKRAQKVGVKVIKKILDLDCTQEEFDRTLEEINSNPLIHGILMFRPLPKPLDNEKARKMLNPAKDIDGCTDGSLAGVFTNTDIGFAPCTAQAAIEILKYYNIPIEGKKVCVMGRSLVIGRPVAMLLMHENATVVNCHTRTKNPQLIAREADILIAAVGKLHSIDKAFTNEEQVIIDVGINWDDSIGKIAGDVDFDDVEPAVKAITPVPGGVGTVTTSVLISNVVQAAKDSFK